MVRGVAMVLQWYWGRGLSWCCNGTGGCCVFVVLLRYWGRGCHGTVIILEEGVDILVLVSCVLVVI